MSKIIYQDQYGTYTIDLGEEHPEHMSSVICRLIAPVMLAAGFTEKTVSEYLNHDACWEEQL